MLPPKSPSDPLCWLSSSAIAVSNQFYLFQVKIKDRFAGSLHRRVGLIFHNRCKSILCQVQEKSYLYMKSGSLHLGSSGRKFHERRESGEAGTECEEHAFLAELRPAAVQDLPQNKQNGG